MTYQELQELKERIKKFRDDKTKIAEGDVLERMRNKICDQMALIGYQNLEEKSLELIFVKEFLRLLDNVERKDIKGFAYIKVADIRNALDVIKNKSIFS